MPATYYDFTTRVTWFGEEIEVELACVWDEYAEAYAVRSATGQRLQEIVTLAPIGSGEPPRVEYRPMAGTAFEITGVLLAIIKSDEELCERIAEAEADGVGFADDILWDRIKDAAE